MVEHPASPLRQAIGEPLLRRVLMGMGMGGTAVAIIYSPWGQQSGAHLNPAVTLTFFRLGKVRGWDALFYVAAQFLGGAAGVLIAFGLMLAVLTASNTDRLARFTGLFAGLLVATYITVEAPLSGMSLNPASTVASALPGRLWTALWIYFTAPPLGMLLAAQLYLAVKGAGGVLCAKLHHGSAKRCIFRCGYQQQNQEAEHWALPLADRTA